MDAKAMKQMGEGVRDYIEQALSPLVKRIAELETQADTMRERGISYRGVWQSADQYKRGDLATHAGSIWHCNADTRSAPGDGKAWTLACKGNAR